MGVYGGAAIKAVEYIRSGDYPDPRDAWKEAIREETGSKATEGKPCPRCAFLGLCECGLVRGVRPGNYTYSRVNKRYAVDAIRMLRVSEKKLRRADVWARVAPGITEGGQMDVVFALWEDGLIVRS
jgi:hypothetical protein